MVLCSLFHRSNIRVGDYARVLDGLVLQGGADVSPLTYGEEPLDSEWARPVRAFVEDLHRQPEKPSDETRGNCRLVLHGAAILHPNDELANASGDQSPTHAPDMQNRT